MPYFNTLGPGIRSWLQMGATLLYASNAWGLPRSRSPPLVHRPRQSRDRFRSGTSCMCTASWEDEFSGDMYTVLRDFDRRSLYNLILCFQLFNGHQSHCMAYWLKLPASFNYLPTDPLVIDPCINICTDPGWWTVWCLAPVPPLPRGALEAWGSSHIQDLQRVLPQPDAAI